jgi:hypothetical protein
MAHTDDYRKLPGANNKMLIDKMGPNITRALMTAPGKTRQASIQTYERKTGNIIHDPRIEDCACSDCHAARMAALWPQAVIGNGY